MSQGPRFEKLFEPIRIGQMEVKNRIMMPPMETFFGTNDGFVTERLKDHYEARARGGVGLITVQATYVVPLEAPPALRIDDDRYISRLSELVEVIHRHGAKAALQLQHWGRLSREFGIGPEPVGPSAIPVPGYETPRELSIGEIEELVTRYATAAERAKRAGFDGVEIHAAGGYLVCSFLSAASNKRQDAYGGGLENRARLLLEIIAAIKGAVGDGYPVWYRACVLERGVREGITLEEGLAVAQMAQRAGVDAVNVYASGGWSYAFPTMSAPPGTLVPLAESVKRVVSVPVITVGKVTPEFGEEVLRQGKADLIAMGRALLADPELPSKLISGRLEDIRPCIHCLHCLDGILLAKELTCVTNASLGREKECELRAAKRKRVVIVGGGPGGMEAARVAAMRGKLLLT